MADQSTSSTPCVLAERNLAVLELKLENLTKSNEKLTAAIVGNGKPGLEQRVFLIETFIEELKNERKERRGDIKSIVLPLVRDAVYAVGAVLVTLFATGQLPK